MDIFLDKVRFDELYNCSFYNYSAIIPREHRRNVAHGIVFLSCYAIFEFLYVPCLAVFARRENMRDSCYKLMLFMALLDVVNIHTSCLIVGVYALRGDVFCDRPVFNYLLGMPLFGFYCAGTLTGVILALNRCVEMWDAHLAKCLFGPFSVYLWILAIILYGLCMGFLTIPPFPNGMLVNWLWDPHAGFVLDTSGTYQNNFFCAHNVLIAISLPSIYVIFYLAMRKRMNQIDDQQHRQKGRNVFIQVALISSLITSHTLLYVYMQYFPIPVWLIVFSSYVWILSQGLVPVVYITLNKHIRKSVRSLFLNPLLVRSKWVAHQICIGKVQPAQSTTMPITR